MARIARRPSWNDNFTQRLSFEREARRCGLVFRPRRGRARRWSYEVDLDVPVFDEQRTLHVQLPAFLDQRPTVTVDGPRCGRHRFGDDSLCMWWGRDDLDHRWHADDGLLALVEHAIEHLYCETSCRRGLGWPKPEAPGSHPQSCSTCQPR